MDEKQNSCIIDLTSNSETEDDTKNTTLKSSFEDNKDTIKSQTRAEGGVKQLNVTKPSDGKKERESLRLQNGSSLQRLNQSNPGCNLLTNNKVKWSQTSNKTAENLFIHPNCKCSLGKTEKYLSFDLHVGKDDISLRKDSRILQDTYYTFYHNRKLYEEKGVIKIKSYSIKRSVKSVDLDCVASHKTITPHKVPITDVVEISSDEEETVDVPKAHPLSVKQIQTQEKEVKSYKLKEDELIQIHELEAKEYKGVTIKRGTSTSKPINIEMSPCIINTNITSEADGIAWWEEFIKDTVQEWKDNEMMKLVSNTGSKRDENELNEIDTHQITVKSDNKKSLKKTERMKKEAKEIEARKKKEGEIKNKVYESDEQVLDRLFQEFNEISEKEEEEEKIEEEEEEEREMDKSSFKQKIISETMSSKQDQDNGAAIIPKETVGTNTIVSTSTHPNHQTTKSKIPPKIIFNEQTLNDMNGGKILFVQLERLSISQIPLNQLHKLSNNNATKQQKIKPTHDQIQKPPSKKRGRKRRIDVQNGKQDFNSRNEAESPAKRTRMSLQRDCKNRSVYNRNEAESPAKRTRMSLQRDCKNRSVYKC